jgi:putative glutathione S-transferase
VGWSRRREPRGGRPGPRRAGLALLPEVDASVTPDGRDPVTGVRFLAEAYRATDPDYDGRVTVPTLWDRKTQRVVSNEFLDLPRQLNTEMAALGDPEVDLYPVGLREEIDAVSESLYHDVNNGVYKAGLATTQEAHDEAVDALFARLAWLEERLGTQRYLVGDRLTLADVALFPTLARFDAVYAVHFKCTRRRLVDHPNLWAYARDLYQHPGVAETVDLDHIMRHYYLTHPHLNPSGLVPEPPDAAWHAPHGREALS